MTEGDTMLQIGHQLIIGVPKSWSKSFPHTITFCLQLEYISLRRFKVTQAGLIAWIRNVKEKYKCIIDEKSLQSLHLNMIRSDRTFLENLMNLKVVSKMNIVNSLMSVKTKKIDQIQLKEEKIQ